MQLKPSNTESNISLKLRSTNMYHCYVISLLPGVMLLLRSVIPRRPERLTLGGGGRTPGSFRFDWLLKFETKTDFYNMVFNAHCENVLFPEIIKKSYYDSKLFIYYVFV